MDDGLGEAMRVNCKAALKAFSPQMVCMAMFFALTTLPSYTEQRGLLFLFVNYVMSNITLNLMLSTMTGKKFRALQPVICILMVPLVAYHGFGISAESELLLTKGLTAAALLFFYGKMSIVSVQWCDYA